MNFMNNSTAKTVWNGNSDIKRIASQFHELQKSRFIVFPKPETVE